MTRTLNVYLFDHLVGVLTQTAGKITFRYDIDWLNHPDRRVLSCSLPLQTDPYDDDQCRPFFAGLLPEGQLRKLLMRQFQLSDGNAFGLLNEIGGECAGAVTLSNTTLPRSANENADIRWLDEVELAKLLDELPQRPMLAGDDGMRLSLAGAQDKLPVVADGGRVGLAMNGTPSTHILKSAITTLDDSVDNEAFCLALANAVGISAARATICHTEKHKFLLVKRYDRIKSADGRLHRLHQEDFCQALGHPSDAKYQHEGGPALNDCFNLIRQVTRPSAPAVLQLLDYIFFNTMIGNHDAHAKNFSLLYTSARPTLAPLYDALCTASYSELTNKMAMKIGSQYTFKGTMPRHWEQFAEANGLAPAQTKKRLATLAGVLPVKARQLLSQSETHQFEHSQVLDRILGIIDQRCTTTLRRLAA